MPEIKHKDLIKSLKAMAPADMPGTVLIHGEELLVKTALKTLLDRLLPGESRKLNFEPVDGSETAIAEAIEKVNTYSLLAEPKVVAIIDSQVFYSKQDTTAILDRAREASKRQENRKAALLLLKVMALLGLTYDEVTPELQANALKLNEQQRRDDRWLTDLVGYCRGQGLQVPKGGRMAAVLERAVTRGFPADQYLVITTDVVDRRRSLYKAMVKSGLVINCAVPKGARKADQMAQAAALNEQLSIVLADCGKKIAPDARAQLADMIGFNLRTVINSVKQLASYIGQRETITAEDVRQVVPKTRHDPLYDFTNAITDRNRAAALIFLDSLLVDKFYPLQLLAAMVNQIRKLIHIKGFTACPAGQVWSRGCPYPYFRDQVIPAIGAHDQKLSSDVSRWEEALSSPRVKKGGKKKKSGKVAADLLIARNPKNPYPVYQLFKKAEHFTETELLSFLKLLDKTDIRLKSTALDPKLVLEAAVMDICP